MRARTIEGREIDLKQEKLDGLKQRLRGAVVLPGETGYEESRTVWNSIIDRKPAIIVKCLGIADVNGVENNAVKSLYRQLVALIPLELRGEKSIRLEHL